jgi:hypothetical protein
MFPIAVSQLVHTDGMKLLLPHLDHAPVATYALHLACENGFSPNVIIRLIEVNPNILNETDHKVWYPIHRVMHYSQNSNHFVNYFIHLDPMALQRRNPQKWSIDITRRMYR